MIKLYGSGPRFGQPDSSPFVIKAELLLRMSKLPYERAQMSFSAAPKGKIPYIEDGGPMLGDSHFIQRHLEHKYSIDFSGGYDASTTAAGFGLSRMMEEHFYFLLVQERWMNDDNFNAGPRQFFKAAPAPIRPFVQRMVRGRVRALLKAQGIGRHGDGDRTDLVRADVAAVGAYMGSSPYLLGNRVSAADACVFPQLWSATASIFKGAVRDAVLNEPAVNAYVKRMASEFFPDFPNG